MTGRTTIVCDVRDGRSYVARYRHDGLARVSRPRRAGDAAHVVVSHLGPGIIGGDRYAVEGTVAAGAALLVTGQMATPVYARVEPARVDATWSVGAGGSLVVRAEPVLLDPDAVYDACTRVAVGAGGRAILADVVAVAAGGLARVRTSAFAGDVLVARDACDLRASDAAVATLLVVASDATERARLAAAFAPLVAGAPDVRGGIGGTDGALIVRATAPRIWSLRALLAALIAAADPQAGRAAA